MPDRAPIRHVIGLPPDDTVRAFDARATPRLTTHWTEMMGEEHARAFTVAKIAKLDLLQEIQSSLADMLANGGTFEQWQAGIVPYLQKQGWWGTVQDRSLTGTDEPVTIGPRRLRTIYDTNLRVSRAAGRWARIQALKGERPFLRYVAVLDRRTRPAHRAWHGTILDVDHEWWDTHFPPCGWYCRCTVRQLSQRELDAKGWNVTDVPPSGPDVPFYRPGSSAPVMVPAGISPGFDYNPGKANVPVLATPDEAMEQSRSALRDITRRAAEALEKTAGTNLPAARAIATSFVRSDVLPTLFAHKATFPVAVLDAEQVANLGAQSPVVVLPAGVQRKQERRHPELTIADYRRLPDMLHDPVVVILSDQDSKLVYYSDRSGRLWKAVLRADADQPNPAVVTLHMTNEADIRREARRGRIIVDRRQP